MKKTLLFVVGLSLTAPVFAAPSEKRNPSDIEQISPQQGQQIWEMKQLVQQLQTQTRQLLGKIEEQEYQIEQLNKDLENRYNDLDQRFEILTQQINSTDEDETATSEDNSQETPPESTTTNPQTTEETDNNNNDQSAYNAAYEAYQAGGAVKAIPLMSKFINTFPNSPYISHAYFWLAEFNLKLSPANIHEARDNFEVIVGNYPNSNKAPAALYRLIDISLNVDQDINKARTFFQQLIQKYPASQEARSARSNFSL